MKNLFAALGSLFLLGVILVTWTGFYFYKEVSAPQPAHETKILLIERGTGTAGIAQMLEDENVIRSALAFKAAAYIQKTKGSLKAGEYEFTPGQSMQDVLDMLREGRVYDRKITFPEGLTSHQIVSALNDITDMLSAATVTEIPKEGSLLPETYHYVRNTSRQEILNQMAAAMKKTIDELWPTRSADLPFTTPEEAITLASIVEKETGVAHERKKVAGVFINRLRRGIPLQSDPTVIYAMTNGQVEDGGQGPIGRRLLTKDLSTPSPYNTYENAGLPPGPIANPGRDSIEAVLHPEIHDFIYFVADGTGGHVFARTLAEHNSNVAKWRQIRRQQNN